MPKTKIFITAFLLLSVALAANAHQPRIVEQTQTNIQNPEISQAFYSELTGEPHVYLIEEDQPFKLYVGVLVPDLPDIDTDYQVEIIQLNVEKPFEYTLDGTKHTWTSFYEEFGGDYYLEGPELKDPEYEGELPKGVEVNAGKYQITVSSTDNFGKYVLVAGEKEEFPPAEIWNTLIALPKLKKDFFEKSAFSAFNNRIGLFLLPVLIILIVIVIIIILIIKKKRKK